MSTAETRGSSTSATVRARIRPTRSWCMSRHHRSVPLLSILVRLGWRRDSNNSTTRCLDGRGRSSTLEVGLGHGYVTLEASSEGRLYLSPLQVGRLRAALKDVLLDLDLLAGDQPFHGRSRRA